MTDDVDEARLLRRLQRRDEAAFVMVVELYQSRVFGLVFRMLGDAAEAEDVAQEVFVTVFKAIDTFRGDSKLSTWIYRIATNHCKNRIKYLARRHHNRTRELDDANEADFSAAWSERSPRPDDLLAGRQLEAAIQEALAELDPEHREVIILRDIDQLSYMEIAEITGIAEGTVKSRLFRGRAALKALIEAKSRR